MRLLTQISMKEGDLIDKSTDMVKRSIFLEPTILNFNYSRNLQSNFYNNWLFFLHELGGVWKQISNEKLQSMDFWTDLYQKF